MQLDAAVRVGLGEARQPGQQPAVRQRAQRGDPQRHAVRSGMQVVGDGGNIGEGGAGGIGQLAALGGQPDPARMAQEQAGLQHLFQAAHMMADRAGGQLHVQPQTIFVAGSDTTRLCGGRLRPILCALARNRRWTEAGHECGPTGGRARLAHAVGIDSAGRHLGLLVPVHAGGGAVVRPVRPGRGAAGTGRAGAAAVPVACPRAVSAAALAVARPDRPDQLGAAVRAVRLCRRTGTGCDRCDLQCHDGAVRRADRLPVLRREDRHAPCWRAAGRFCRRGGAGHGQGVGPEHRHRGDRRRCGVADVRVGRKPGEAAHDRPAVGGRCCGDVVVRFAVDAANGGEPLATGGDSAQGVGCGDCPGRGLHRPGVPDVLPPDRSHRPVARIDGDLPDSAVRRGVRVVVPGGGGDGADVDCRCVDSGERGGEPEGLRASTHW
ncbi:hypothetical protein G6F57_014707 [Rhizopus arrhizus]|nr:hypothetical protein G6F57_014707 [Rhizopus arrhizus]